MYTAIEKCDDAGVYMLVSKRTGASYIGSSAYMEERVIQHTSALIRGVHQNPVMQAGFAGHEQAEIEVRILERLEVTHYSEDVVGVGHMSRWEGMSDLRERERHWIQTLRPQLNQNRPDETGTYEGTQFVLPFQAK